MAGERCLSLARGTARGDLACDSERNLGWGANPRTVDAAIARVAKLGVTSPLWDLAFGTYRVPGIIKVPPRLAMVWLIDPATGAIHADHAGTYVLGKQRTPSPAAEPGVGQPAT